MVATLTEVANAAGVSLATASRAFNEPDRLAQATRDKVLRAASELRYQAPLPRGSRTFVVVVPDVGNAVFALLLRSIHEQAWQGRHQMLLVDAREDPAREREVLQTVGRSVDGVILCSPRLPPATIDEARGATNLVVVNGGTATTPSVLMDVEQGMRQTVEHLEALGHRRLAFVPGPAAAWANARRLQCLVDLAAGRGLELATVGNQAASVNGGLAAAAAVVASGATAVVAYNDFVALGVRSGARSLGRRCPEDLSVVGIDDIDVAAASDPGMTSVQVAVERSGAVAVAMLLDRIAGKPVPAEPVYLPSQLIVRGSTAAAPARSGSQP